MVVFGDKDIEYDGYKITKFGDKTYEYDNAGNRTKQTENGIESNYAWKRGHELSEITKIGVTLATYKYNIQGQRINKQLSSLSKNYYYDGNRLIREKWSDACDDEVDTELIYYYDLQGVTGIGYNGVIYKTVRNIFGDVVMLVRGNNSNIVAQYEYDAWGNHKVLDEDGNEITDLNHIGRINPIRYRGYYYDEETGLYYLQSRYYDPSIAHFISPDSEDYLDPFEISGYNLYAYCGFNPIMNVDPTGHAFLLFLVAGLIGFAVSFTASAATQAALNNGEVNWGVAGIDGAFGALSGALWMIPGLGHVATGLINAGLTAANGIITTGMENDWNYTWQDYASIAFSAILSGVVSGITRNQFLKANGKQILKDSHKLVGTIGKRIIIGHYNDGVSIFSKSFRSATGQMLNSIAETNFGKGFYKDWILTGFQAIFTTSFSMGFNGIKW